MKKSLSHLPENKKNELLLITSIITTIVKKVEMVILYGSFARGDYVEDSYVEDNITYEKRSDYDILVIVRNHQLVKDLALWDRLDREIKREPSIKNIVSIIVHPIDEINALLKKGHYFFTDIKKEGIILYDSDKYELADAVELTMQERKELALDNFTRWLRNGEEFFETYQFNMNLQRYNLAAFNLHQTVECYYSSFLLVFTCYKPKSHDIQMFGEKASMFNQRFLQIFPRTTEKDRHRFNLLKKAYIDARYNKHYVITEEDLLHLEQCTRRLYDLVKETCNAKIDSMGI